MLALSVVLAVRAYWPSDPIAPDEAHAQAIVTSTTPPPSKPDRASPPHEPEPESGPEPPAPKTKTKSHAIGWVTINAQPWAYVSIDGKRLPNPTPLRHHPLRTGRHEVHLVSPSLGVEEDRIVDVRAGKTTTLLHQFSSR
jgi:hypothetical protein